MYKPELSTREEKEFKFNHKNYKLYGMTETYVDSPLLLQIVYTVQII